MRIGTWVAALALAAGFCCLGWAQSNEAAEKAKSQWPGYAISAVPIGKQLRLDSPINIEITITNLTDKFASWCNAKSETVYMHFRFSLIKDGREVEKTLFHQNLTGRQQPTASSEDWNEADICGILPPGANHKSTIDLKRLYEITEPGQYTLEVSHLEEDQKTIVAAPKLELKIDAKLESGN